MNAALMCVYNRTPEQLDMTKRAIESVLAQDVPVRLHVIDNGSTPETWEYLSTFDQVIRTRNQTNTSPCEVANLHLHSLFASMFEDEHEPFVLCLPNDVVLPTNFYSELLRWPRGVVTASMSPEMPPHRADPSNAVNTCTPMAVLLLRKWVYDAVVSHYGHFFDTNFFHYASDCDLALRIAACGITGVQLDLPYYHYTSATLRLADAEYRQFANQQADTDRTYFQRKWGFGVSDARYGQNAADINFRGEAQ